MSSLSRLSVGLEVLRNNISYTLFNDLVVCLKKVHGTKNYTTAAIASAGVNELFKDRLNIKVTLTCPVKDRANKYNAMVVVPTLDKNNPMVNQLSKGALDQVDFHKSISSTKKVLTGDVDLKTGRVDGVFTQVESRIYIGFRLFDPKYFTPEETAAIILHEIGHLITFYAAFVSTVRTNFVLQQLNLRSYIDAPAKARIKLLHEVDKELGVTIPEKELVAEGDVNLVQTVVVREDAIRVRSELGYDYYDQRSYEAMADRFATSMGAGAPLTKALAKIYKYSGGNSILHSGFWLTLQLIGLLQRNVGFIIGSIVIAALVENTYDKAPQRIKRIKERLVEELKNRDIPTEAREKLLADIESIELDDAKYKQVLLFGDFIWNKVLPWGRRNQKTIKLQQELETLANNDLYVKAAQLR